MVIDLFSDLANNSSHIHETVNNIANLHHQTQGVDLAQINSTHAELAANATSTTTAHSATNQAAAAGCFIGAGLAMTGAIGVGFGQGYVGGKAALAVAKNPDEYSRIRAMMLIGAAIAESSAIYALIIAILLIFVAPHLS